MSIVMEVSKYLDIHPYIGGASGILLGSIIVLSIGYFKAGPK